MDTGRHGILTTRHRQVLIKPFCMKANQQKTLYRQDNVRISQSSMATRLQRLSWLNAEGVRDLEGSLSVTAVLAAAEEGVSKVASTPVSHFNKSFLFTFSISLWRLFDSCTFSFSSTHPPHMRTDHKRVFIQCVMTFWGFVLKYITRTLRLTLLAHVSTSLITASRPFIGSTLSRVVLTPQSWSQYTTTLLSPKPSYTL